MACSARSPERRPRLPMRRTRRSGSWIRPGRSSSGTPSASSQSAIAIRNVQLYDEAERRRRQAETLAVLGRTIGASLDLDVVLQQAVEATRDLLGCDHAVIALRDHEAEVMRMRYGAPHHLSRAYEGFRVERGKGLGGLAWALG